MTLIDSAYTAFLRVATAGRGLPWKVDDRLTLRIDPRCRWIRNPAYEADVVAYLKARIRPGQNCIDVGAHVGFYAMQMAHWIAPSGRVVAFEPNPVARAVLHSNARMNHLTGQIRIEASAVGAHAGSANLFHARHASGLSRLDAPNPGGDRSAPLPVDVVTLDEYCDGSGFRPDWILVDAEGADLSVLRGAARLLTDTPVEVVVEMHAALWDPSDTTAEAFEAFLASCGRTAVPITGQARPLQDYGTVALLRTDC